MCGGGVILHIILFRKQERAIGVFSIVVDFI